MSGSRDRPASVWDTVAIIGVGLIGGSIGLRLLRQGLARRVIGVGRRASSLRVARRRGAVTSTTTDLRRGVRRAELVVVCTPVDLIVPHVLEAAAACPPSAIITDTGSTKAEIVQRLDGQLPGQVCFVGGHPLAGSEKGGPQAARDDLFENRLVVLTPTRRTAPASLAAVEGFWQSLGARVQRMSPRQHDQAMAVVSHLPHLVASALAAATPAKHRPLAATGWSDTTRIAAGDVHLWQQILSQNREPLLAALENLERWLAKFRRALERNDRGQLLGLLEAGKRNRDAVGN